MRIIAYTFEADVHCPNCTRRAATDGRFSFALYEPKPLDEHGIPCDVGDREGNPIHPVFDIDENDFTHCGDCHEELQ